MRTSIFILALAVHDVARELGAPELDFGFWIWFLFAFAIMDVVDFLRNRK